VRGKYTHSNVQEFRKFISYIPFLHKFLENVLQQNKDVNTEGRIF
jgi:hypothetical protein